MLPKLSVCIPAYNRSEYLPALLDSILSQNYPHLEIVVVEDNSPQRAEIAAVIAEYERRGHTCLRYFENVETKGFDGNVRELIARATGDYCVMMGNDDLLCEGSLATIGGLLEQHPEVVVAIRSYGWFYSTPDKVDQVVQQFPDTRLFEPGEQTAVTFFRRVGVLAGLVYRRDAAQAAATDAFDGTLYYQVYLAAEMLLQGSGLYIAETIALCRENQPEFGQSSSERGRYTPGSYTSNSRVIMIQNFIQIAEEMDRRHGTSLVNGVLKDLGNYSYYFLAFLARGPRREFWRQYRILGRMGFDSNPMFHIYFWALFVLGLRVCEAGIKFLRKLLGATPRLGKLSAGKSVGNSEA